MLSTAHSQLAKHVTSENIHLTGDAMQFERDAWLITRVISGYDAIHSGTVRDHWEAHKIPVRARPIYRLLSRIGVCRDEWWIVVGLRGTTAIISCRKCHRATVYRWNK